MTIVQPKKEIDLRRSVTLCVAGMIFMLAAALFSYLSLVDLRHDIVRTGGDLEELKIANAELKNRYYNFTSNENLERLALELGLVKDRTPQWVLASQR